MGRLVTSMTVLLVLTVACGSVPHHPAPRVVEWLALSPSGLVISASPPPATAPVPIPAGTRACKAAQLEGVKGPGNAAGGHLDQLIVLRNRSGVACVLEGYPDLAVLAADGTTLASVAGETGRGTFFPSGPSVPILMLPGTAPLSTTYDPEAPFGARGQSHLDIEWLDCKTPIPAQLRVTPPGDSAPLLVAFPGPAEHSAACDGPTPASPSITRGPFEPSGYTWPPQPVPISTAITIAAPASVRRGSVLQYTVTLSNHGDQPYQLNPCPDYIEFLGGKVARYVYALNCAPVSAIAPAASVTFAMEMTIPATVATGPSGITWALSDGRVFPSEATTPIQVTA
jgi:Protein of unknown function (DUF4232)